MPSLFIRLYSAVAARPGQAGRAGPRHYIGSGAGAPASAPAPEQARRLPRAGSQAAASSPCNRRSCGRQFALEGRSRRSADRGRSEADIGSRPASMRGGAPMRLGILLMIAAMPGGMRELVGAGARGCHRIGGDGPQKMRRPALATSRISVCGTRSAQPRCAGRRPGAGRRGGPVQNFLKHSRPVPWSTWQSATISVPFLSGAICTT